MIGMVSLESAMSDGSVALSRAHLGTLPGGSTMAIDVNGSMAPEKESNHGIRPSRIVNNA